MKFTLTLFAFLLIAITQTVSWESCLARPPNLSKGTSCGGAISCQFGLYCDKTGMCDTQIAVGGSCNYNTDCVYGSTCRGVSGSKTCVAKASAGQACTFDYTNSTLPVCGSLLSCTAGICVGGFVGDSCVQTSDCVSQLTCTSGTCTAIPDGGNCTATYQCSPNSYCTFNGLYGNCVAKKTLNMQCQSTSECAFSFICSKNTQYDANMVCLAALAKKTGDYCIAHGECESKRCAGSTCAKNPLIVCSSSPECAYNQFCGCSNIISQGGVGTCTDNPCWTKYEDFLKCASQNCGQQVSDHSGSCIQKVCAKEAQDYQLCSPAGTLTASLFTIIFALIALYSLKN